MKILKLKKTLSTAFVISILFISCETDVDVFADGKRVPVVFALLEPANPVQYFRINPTFIGEGDAREFAGDPNLTNYKKGEIEVKLIDLTEGIEYILKDSFGIIDLEPNGIFNAKNRIYYLDTPVNLLLNPDGTVTYNNDVLIPFNDYRLRIKDLSTGLVSFSDIKLGDINQLRMTIPKPGKNNSRSPFNMLNFFTSTEYNSTYTFKFTADNISERFLVEMNFYHTEEDPDSQSKDSLVNFEIGEINEVDDFGGFNKEVALDFNGERFYSILENKLPMSTKRAGQTADLLVTAVGPDLDVYVSVQNASLTSISQERPSYSNIENGLGVFSYRLQKKFSEYKLNESSAKQLFNGSYTTLRFKCALHGTQGNSLGFPACR